MAVCAVCGSAAAPNVTGVLPDAADPPDFDTRPGKPLRSTLPAWLLLCPACGYVADDLTRADERAREVVRSPEYQDILRTGTDSGSRKFLAYAYLLSKLYQHADAGWSALHAAWACDDENAVDAARDCRRTAIQYWQRGKQTGQVFCDDLPSEFALITDIYRRIGEFEHATVTASEGLDLDDLPPALEAVLRRQLVLIQQRDTDAHSMRELISS